MHHVEGQRQKNLADGGTLNLLWTSTLKQIEGGYTRIHKVYVITDKRFELVYEGISRELAESIYNNTINSLFKKD